MTFKIFMITKKKLDLSLILVKKIEKYFILKILQKYLTKILRYLVKILG